MTVTQPPANARLAHIADAIHRHKAVLAARDGVYFEAAVTLILRETDDNDLELLFIRRAVRAGDPWSGQVAFPGGRHEDSDESLEDTAVRETREEVGLELRRHGSIIGALDEVRPRASILPPVIVRPYVATINAEATIGSLDEIAGFFWAPLDAIFDPAAAHETEIEVQGARNTRPAIHFAGNVIWGMTEHIVRRFEEIIR
jgi:8-oxo-dGTP pyrophosphatase MutT (NUDIX family)